MPPTFATLALFAALTLTFVTPLAAQDRPAERRPGGFPGPGDPSRRTEMIADRLAEDIGLSRDQRNAIKDLFDRAQNAARPFQDQLQSAHAAIRAAIRAGTNTEAIASLHVQIGTNTVQLAAIQSAAFGDALKILTAAQTNDADILYEVLGFVAGPGPRSPNPFRGGPGGPGGPGGFGNPGRRQPGFPNPGTPSTPEPHGSAQDGPMPPRE
jgi:Spy/CpxP family protein refolding chaperone